MIWSNHNFQVGLYDVSQIDMELPEFITEPLIINEQLRIVPVNITPLSYNDKIQRLAGPFYEIKESEVIGTYKIGEKSVEEVQHFLLDKCANSRWVKETQGTVVRIQDTDITIPTNRDERNVFLQTFQCMTDVVNWKFGDTWMTLTKEDMQLIITSIFKHVQQVFEWEQTKASEILKAQTLDELDGIDIS